MGSIDTRISGVVFDLNGTLVERASESAHLVTILVSWLIQRGRDPAELQALYSSGATTKQLLQGCDAMEFYEHRAKQFDPKRLRSHPEASAILRRLTADQGLGLAVLTNNVTHFLTRCLQELHWESFFVYAGGVENGRKPEPGVFLDAIRGLGTCARETVAVGNDAAKDILPICRLGGNGIELSWRDLGELEERIAKREFSHGPASA